MRKLILLALAATVAFPTAALAQGHRGGGSGHMMRGGGGGHMMRGGGVTVHHGGFRGGRFMHPGRNFRHHRLQRGFVIHPFWFGPQFHVQNWQVYGFADPGRDRRWVRYYDDAYLIDREGRVQDERRGLDWDEYGERWEMDDGIPSYYGRNEWRPGDEDYAWAERHGGPARGDDDWDYREYGHGGGSGQPMPPPGYGHPMPPGYGQGYGYGGGYGYYGYGVAYPIVIETTVVTGASYVEEVVEEVVETRRPRVRRPCRCPRPARPAPRPRPPAGERG